MTGKAAEIAAILLRLPLNVDFFQLIADDLVADGCLHPERRLEVYRPCRGAALIGFEALRALVSSSGPGMPSSLGDTSSSMRRAPPEDGRHLAALFADWREPVLRRTLPDGRVVSERECPAAMLAYLFGEVAKNLYLIHTRRRGSRCLALAARRPLLRDRPGPPRMRQCSPRSTGKPVWKAGAAGGVAASLWRPPVRPPARPDDATSMRDPRLQAVESSALTRGDQMRFWEGGSFFRGLALVDLAEAMLNALAPTPWRCASTPPARATFPGARGHHPRPVVK